MVLSEVNGVTHLTYLRWLLNAADRTATEAENAESPELYSDIRHLTAGQMDDLVSVATSSSVSLLER